MALKLKISVCDTNCKYFLFEDLTGTYSLVNETGWNSPNTDITEATGATLTITDPDTTETVINLFTLDFPSLTDLGTNITNVQLGYSTNENLNTGIWTFLYTVVTTEGTFTKEKKLLVTCKIKCAIDALRLQILNNCDKQKKKELEAQIQELDNLLAATIYAAECGSTSQVESLLDALNDLIETNNCGCS